MAYTTRVGGCTDAPEHTVGLLFDAGRAKRGLEFVVAGSGCPLAEFVEPDPGIRVTLIVLVVGIVIKMPEL